MLMGHMGNTAVHVDDTALLPGQKNHITTFKCMINGL